MNNSLGYRTLKSMIWGYIGKFLEFSLAGIFSIIVGRKLGPAIYGHYNLFISIISTFILFSSFGLDAILNKFIPQLAVRQESPRAYALFLRMFYLRLLVTLFFCIILFFSRAFLASFFLEDTISQYFFFFVAIFILIAVQNIPISVFNSLLKLKEIAIVRAVSQSVGLITVVFLFYFFEPSIKSVFQSVVFYNLIFTVIIFVFSLNLFNKLNKVSKLEVKNYLSFGLSVWEISLLTYAISTTLNILLMSKVTKDPFQIGLYSTAILFTYLPGNLISSWAGIMLPSLSEVKAKYGVSGISQAFISFSKVIFFMLIPMLFFLMRYADVLVHSLFGEDFIQSVLLIQIFAFFNIFSTFFAPNLGLNTLYAIDKEKIVVQIRLLAGLLNIVLVLLFAIFYKALGVMIASCIVIVFINVAEFIVVKKSVHSRYPFMYLFKILMSSTVGLLLICWFPVKNLLTLIAIGIVYLIIIFVIFYFIKLLNKEDREFLIRMHPALAAIVKYF